MYITITFNSGRVVVTVSGNALGHLKSRCAYRTWTFHPLLSMYCIAERERFEKCTLNTR